MRARYLTYLKTSVHACTFVDIQALDSDNFGANIIHCQFFEVAYPFRSFILLYRARRERGWEIPRRLAEINQAIIEVPRGGELYLCGHPHWYYHGRPQCRDDDLHPSFRGLYRLDFESGLGHAYRSRARDGHLCEESSRLCYDEVEMLIDGEESGHDGCLDHGHHPERHGRSQTARMRKEAYGPTELRVSLTHVKWVNGTLSTSIFKTSSRPRRLLCIS